MQIASRIFCDATDGALRITDVTLSAGGPTEEQADAWIYANDGRSDGAADGFGVDGSHVALLQPNIDGDGGGVIAHEFMHHILGIADEYYEARRFGGACGIGEGFETQSNFMTSGDTRTEAAHRLPPRHLPSCAMSR